jgi:hypothetical protein
MRREIRFGFVLLAIFAVAAILITPTPFDDVDGLLHLHHSQVSSPIVRSQLHDLITAFQSPAETLSIVDLRLDFLNLFCVRLF